MRLYLCSISSFFWNLTHILLLFCIFNALLIKASDASLWERVILYVLMVHLAKNRPNIHHDKKTISEPFFVSAVTMLYCLISWLLRSVLYLKCTFINLKSYNSCWHLAATNMMQPCKIWPVDFIVFLGKHWPQLYSPHLSLSIFMAEVPVVE